MAGVNEHIAVKRAGKLYEPLRKWTAGKGGWKKKLKRKRSVPEFSSDIKFREFLNNYNDPSFRSLFENYVTTLVNPPKEEVWRL